MSGESATPAAGMPTGAASLAGAKRRFSFNAVCNVASFLTQVLAAFIVTPIVVHGLGNVAYGVWGLVGQTVTSMSLLDFGIGIAVSRYFAHHIALDEREQTNRVASTGLVLSFIPFAVAILAGAGIAAVAPRFFHIAPAMVHEVRVTIVLMATAVAFMFPGGVLGAAITATSRYDLLSLRTVIWIALRAVLYWTVLRLGGGLIALASVALGVELFALGLGALLAWRLVPWVRFLPRLASRETLSSLLSFSGYAFVLSVAVQVIFSCDNIVVGWALGPLAVAFYAVAANLAEQLRMSTKVLTTLYSALATQIHALEGNRGEGLRRLFLTGSRLTLMLVLPGCIGLCLLGPQFLQLWLGPLYSQRSSAILVLLTLTVLSFALAVSSTQILYGMNRARWNAWMSLSEAGVNLGLSLLLVWRLGAIGVAWGTAIPAVAFEALALPLYTARQVGMPAWRLLRDGIAGPLLVGLPLALWCWVWRMSGLVTTWPRLLGVALGGLVVFFLCLRAYGIAPSERDSLRGALQRWPFAVRLLLGSRRAAAAAE